MLHYCYFLGCLTLLLSTSPVGSSDSTGRRRRALPRPIWSTLSPSAETPREEDLPLQSAPISLPAVEDNDDTKYRFHFPKTKPCFDVISLKSQASTTSRSKRPNKSASNPHKKRYHVPSGSRFSIHLRPPSPDRITQWFAPGEEGSKRWNRKVSALFNHDSVGMTNPVLGVSVGTPSSMDYEQSTSSITLASSTSEKFELEDTLIPATSNTVTPNSKHPSDELARVLQYRLRPSDDSSRQAAERAWFPSTQQEQQQQQQPSSSRKKNQKWRQCRYRRRVGKGQACYERVRDAALEWQFQHNQHRQQQEGILSVRSAPDSSLFSLDADASEKVQPIWSGPHTGGSRRLVTFTTCGFKTKWLPKLYALNPVMVVYDVLDQRGPATTYTSTAYATLKGHLLSGEERVTVALRDGSGFVDVEILSYSRPAQSMRSKFVWPVIGRMQQRFFEHQLDYLEQVAKPMPPPPPPLPSSATPN